MQIRDKFLDKESKFGSDTVAIFDKVGGAVVEVIMESAHRWSMREGVTLDPNMLDGVARECRSILESKYM